MKLVLPRVARPEHRAAPAVQRRLQWRLVILAGLGMAATLGAFGVSTWLAVNESIDQTLAERSDFAAATANHVDYVLRESLKSLDEVSFTAGIGQDGSATQAASEALRRAYVGSIFSGVYLANAAGRIVAVEPAASNATRGDVGDRAEVAAALASNRPAVSGRTTGVARDGPVVSVTAPLRDDAGRVVGVVGGEIGLASGQLSGVLAGDAVGASYIEIVDNGGVILASTRPSDLLQVSDHQGQLPTIIASGRTVSGSCHSCHSSQAPSTQAKEIIAFAPLKSAPWAVLVREPEHEALAFASQLEQRAIWFGVPAFVLAVMLAWATALSVVRPVAVLEAAAERLASGDLSQPVPRMGKDEIGSLARAFETMRVRLRDARETIESWAGELEGRVRDRTRELEDSRDHLRQVAEENAALYEEVRRKDATRADLLGKVMCAQEEERRRIARELHDETSQALTVLAMGLETAASQWGERERLSSLRDLAVRTIDNVHRLIYDLRPSVLDDLGLVPGLRWCADTRLQPLGIRVSLITEGDERRLRPEVETALFRIGQEAISNVAQHSRASNLFIEVAFEPERVVLKVEDDGDGFETESLESAQPGGRGWGLLGMRERAELVGGQLDVESAPGEGTRVRAEAPVQGGE